MARRGLAVAGGMVLAVTIGVSQAGAQGPAVDLPRLVAGLDFTESGVKRWLERLGATVVGPPSERLLVVRLTGEDVLVRQGNASSVHVDAEIDDDFLAAAAARAVVLVHNHPTSVGLSGPDLGQLAKPGVAAVIAIGHDGSVFVASAGRRMHRDFLESRQYVSAKAEVTRRLRAEWPSGIVSVAVSDAHLESSGDARHGQGWHYRLLVHTARHRPGVVRPGANGLQSRCRWRRGTAQAC